MRSIEVDTHSKAIGYILWIFGFLGAHRFYYGKPVTGTIYFFTLGLLFIGLSLPHLAGYIGDLFGTTTPSALWLLRAVP